MIAGCDADEHFEDDPTSVCCIKVEKSLRIRSSAGPSREIIRCERTLLSRVWSHRMCDPSSGSPRVC